jgi:hypothetical protein
MGMAGVMKILLSVATALLITVSVPGCGSREEYQVFDLKALADYRVDPEKLLNNEAKKGWKLRAVDEGKLYLFR